MKALLFCENSQKHSIKRILISLSAAIGIVAAGQTAAYSAEIYEIIHGRSGTGSIAPRQQQYWKYEVPAGTVGYFTLKNTSKTSDVDIHLFEYDGSQFKKLSKSIQNGTRTELVSADWSSQRKYVYATVINQGGSNASYRLHADYIHPLRKLFVAALEQGVSGQISSNMNASTSEHVDRVVTGLSSSLQNSNLTNVGKDLAIREVTSSMRQQLGYNWFGDLMVNWGASMISGLFKYYP